MALGFGAPPAVDLGRLTQAQLDEAEKQDNALVAQAEAVAAILPGGMVRWREELARGLPSSSAQSMADVRRWLQQRKKNVDRVIEQARRELEQSRRDVRPVVPVEEMPRTPNNAGLFGDDTWWHGSRAVESLTRYGLCVPSGGEMIRPDEGFSSRWDWDDLWGSVAYDWWRYLPREAKRYIQDYTGQNIKSKASLGDAVSLFWITNSRKLADSSGGASFPGHGLVTVDVMQVRAFGFFSDTEYESSTIVLVMPTDCPQAPPSAFKRVI